MSTLETLSREMLLAVQQELRLVLKGDSFPPPDELYALMHYHMGWLDEQFQPAPSKAGKQIRPLLLLLACHAAGGDWQQAIPAAAAIELVHNFSLIHDDIEDGSLTRRGRKTLWSIWGVPLAINAGDAMFALAHLALNQLIERQIVPHLVVTSLRRFDETCIQLTQGQHADMSFEKRGDVSVAEYLAMITGKTSVLLALCAELGATIAGCGQDTIDHYHQFGLNLGLAFQVLDDVLGIWGDEVVIGKSATSDIETRKKTLPVLYGLVHNPALAQLYEQDEQIEEFVSQAVALLNESGAREFAEGYAQKYSEAALHHLSAAQPINDVHLQQLTAQLLRRQS